MSAASLGQRGSLACLVAIALTVTACGSSSGSSAAGKASNTTAPAVTSATTTAAAAATTAAATTPSVSASLTGSGAPATSAATTAAATSAASSPIVLPSTTAAPTKVVAKGGGQFCKDLANVANDTATPDLSNVVAEEKAQAQKSLKELTQLGAEAPSAVKGDVSTLTNAIGAFYAAFAKAGYDPTKLSPAAETAMTAPAVQTAEKNLEAYTKGVCGIDLTGAAASS